MSFGRLIHSFLARQAMVGVGRCLPVRRERLAQDQLVRVASEWIAKERHWLDVDIAVLSFCLARGRAVEVPYWTFGRLFRLELECLRLAAQTFTRAVDPDVHHLNSASLVELQVTLQTCRTVSVHRDYLVRRRSGEERPTLLIVRNNLSRGQKLAFSRVGLDLFEERLKNLLNRPCEVFVSDDNSFCAFYMFPAKRGHSSTSSWRTCQSCACRADESFGARRTRACHDNPQIMYLAKGAAEHAKRWRPILEHVLATDARACF